MAQRIKLQSALWISRYAGSVLLTKSFFFKTNRPIARDYWVYYQLQTQNKILSCSKGKFQPRHKMWGWFVHTKQTFTKKI